LLLKRFGRSNFKDEDYKPDYSQEDASYRHWFIHEMTHVWQYQLGYPVKRVGMSRPHYDYILEASKSFSDYNMEQQGDIIADYFYMKILRQANACKMSQYNRSYLPMYEKILGVFLANPKDKSNLPGQ